MTSLHGFEAPPAVYLSIGCLLILWLIPFVIGALRGRIDLLEVIYPVSTAYFLYFGFRSLLFITEPRETLVSGTLALANTAELVPLALQYAMGGIAVLLLGYYSGVGSRVAQLLPRVWWIRELRLPIGRIVTVFAVGAITQLFIWRGATESAESTVSDLVSHIGFLGFYGSALGLIKLIADPGRDRAPLFLFVLFMFMIETWFVANFGKRGYILLLLLMGLASFHYFKRRVPARRLIVSGLLFACFVFPLTEHWRKIYWFSPQPETPAMGTAYRQALEELKQSETFGDYLHHAVITFSNRLHGLDSLMVGLHKTPATIPFLYGETFQNFFLGVFVPRFLWPQKPKVYFSDIFARDYWGLPPYMHAAIAVSQIGEFYINFGLAGVLLGMFCLGVFYRILYAYFVLQNPRSFGAFIYIFALYTVVSIDGELAVVYGLLVKRIALLFLICAFVNIRGIPLLQRSSPRG